MKKVLFFALLLLTMSVFGQSFDVKYGTFRQYFLMVPMASPPSAPVKGMAYMDTDGQMYVYNGSTWVSGASQWSLSGSDITNTNAGFVIVDSLFKIYPRPNQVLESAENPYQFLVMGNDGWIHRVTPVTASAIIDDTISDMADSGSPPATATWVRDTTLNYLKAANYGDIISNNVIPNSANDLVYWKYDWSKAMLDNQSTATIDNANILVIGDSYAPIYGYPLKEIGGYKYGWGGGYEIFQSNPYGTYGHMCVIGSGWAATYSTTDADNWNDQYVWSKTNAATIKLSAINFNKFSIQYKTKPGYGKFSVTLNSGTPDTVDCNTTEGAGWYTWNKAGNSVYSYYADTVYIRKIGTDTCKLFGHVMAMNPTTYSNDNKKGYLNVHISQNGGSAIRDRYLNRDTSEIHQFLDSTNASLAILTFLDTATYSPINSMDSLIGLLRVLRPAMDIMIVTPNDESDHLGLAQQDSLEIIAKQRGVAYMNAYGMGSYADFDGSGAMTDDIHLSQIGKYLTFWEFENRLFTSTLYNFNATAWKFTNRGDYMIWPRSQNVAIVSRDVGNMSPTANNTLIGYRSGSFVKPSATNITLIGARAGEVITSANYATFVGSLAGVAHTEGIGCTFVGYGSGLSSTTGRYNTFLGYESGRSVAGAGEQNVFLGYNAGYGNVTGDGNIAIGYDAGRGIRNGYNTYIGYQAGYNTQSGANGTAVGSQAGQNVSGGSDVAFFGNMAGYGNTTGSYNTCIGARSGYTNSTSGNNTYIGYRAGYSCTGSGNVFIGYTALDAAGAVSNTLAIDNSNTSAPLIEGDFSANTLKINGTRYDVIGTISDNDSTPSFAGGNLWKYNGTANSVSIDAIDDEVVGALYEIHGNSDTYTITIIDGTPAGGDSFNLAGAAWVGGNQDVLLIRCIATGAFVEVSRSDN